MKHAKYLLIGVPALLAATLAFTPLVHAQPGRSTTPKSSDNSTDQKVAETETTGETETEADSQTSDSTSAERKAEVAKRRAALQLKLQEVKAENKTRLDDARKKVCENRQDQINSIIQKRSEQATKQLAVFTKISDRVQEFVTNKKLTVEDYNSLVASIRDKEVAAQAAIDTNTATTFDCNTASADKPGVLPRTTITDVRTTLQDYRTAIKNLIVKVKASAASTTPAATTNGEVSQ